MHFIDLDRFKEINDTLGHDAGDFLLKTVAERLRAVTRNDDVAARLGGDEFVVIQTGVSEKGHAEDFARRLVSAVTAPMMLKDQEIVATASVGVAMAPTDGTEPERLLKSADLALYKSKADGRNCVHFFVPEMDAALQARLPWRKPSAMLFCTSASFCTISQCSKSPAASWSASRHWYACLRRTGA